MDNVAAGLAQHDEVLKRVNRRFDALEERLERGFSEMGRRCDLLQVTLQLCVALASRIARDSASARGPVDTFVEQQRMADFQRKLLEDRSSH